MQGFTIFNFDGETPYASDTATNYAKYSYGLKMVRLIENAELPDVNNNVLDFGKILGKIFTKFFNVQVPDVQYKAYGTTAWK